MISTSHTPTDGDRSDYVPKARRWLISKALAFLPMDPRAICARMLKYTVYVHSDRLCGLVVRFLGYRSGGPGSIPGTTRKKK
jgi:hypothetical protein